MVQYVRSRLAAPACVISWLRRWSLVGGGSTAVAAGVSLAASDCVGTIDAALGPAAVMNGEAEVDEGIDPGCPVSTLPHAATTVSTASSTKALRVLIRTLRMDKLMALSPNAPFAILVFRGIFPNDAA